MSQFCSNCRGFISQEYYELQKLLLDKINIDNYNNKVFLERCVICYLQFLELKEKEDNKILEILIKHI